MNNAFETAKGKLFSASACCPKCGKAIKIKTEEILGIIHKEGIEAEVFKALSIWLVNDREAQIRRLSQQKATIRTIRKIVNNNPSRAEALNGIKALCECEPGENGDIEE